MSQMAYARISDPIFNRNIQKLISECVVPEAWSGVNYTFNDLKNTDDIWKLIKTNASNVKGFLYKDPETKEAEILTCNEGIAQLEKQWNQQLDLVISKFDNKNFITEALVKVFKDGAPDQSYKNTNIYKKALLSSLNNVFEDFIGIGTKAEDVLKQEMMINAMMESPHNSTSELGGSLNYASTKALLQQRSTYKIVADIAAQTLPVMKVVFEALIYGIFPFIILIALMPGGYKYLYTYFGSVMWIQLWAPLYAILNMIMTYNAQDGSLSLIQHKGLTLMNSVGLINLNTDKCTLAGWLSMSVPFISYVMIKSGAGALANLATSLSSGYQSASASVASEVTSGNISMNNISQGTRSLDNTAAFQYNTSASFKAGQFESVQDDGSIKTTNADGSVVYRAGSGITSSQFQTDIRLNEGISSQLSKNIADERSFIESKSKELSNAESLAVRQTADFVERIGKGISSGEHYDLSESTSHAKSIQNTLDFSKNLQEKFDLNERQAVTLSAAVAASANATIGNKNSLSASLSAVLDGKYASDTARTQLLEEATSYAKREGFYESIDSITRASKDIRYSESQSSEASFAKGLSESTDKIHSLRESISTSEQNVARFSDALSYSETEGASITTDANQRYLEYVANQYINRGPNQELTKIGYDQAKRIINSGNSQAKAYQEAFVKQETNKLMNSFDQHSRNHENFASSYNNKKLELDHNSVPSGEAVFRANERNLSTQFEDKNIKNDVNSSLSNNSQEILLRKQSSSESFDTKQDEIRKEQNENLLFKAVKNSIGRENENKN
jgi:conjugal transfer mating pair stabilization protein TraG